jgi:hypothetical protein
MSTITVECSECGYAVGTDCECLGKITRVTYSGSPGSYYDQPEPAEFEMWCPVCQENTEGYGDHGFEVTCNGYGEDKPSHSITVEDDDDR